MTNNTSSLERVPQARESEGKRLDISREGQPGLDQYLKIDYTIIDGEKIKIPVAALNDRKGLFVFREAEERVLEEEKREALAQMESVDDPFAKAEIAKAAVRHGKEEVTEIPQFINFLEDKKDQIQLIDVERDVAYLDGSGRVLSTRDYFQLKGIPTNAENYFLTSLHDIGGFNDLERYGLKVEYVYTRPDGTTSLRPIGFKASEKGQPKMVFLFAETSSAENTDHDQPGDARAEYSEAA